MINVPIPKEIHTFSYLWTVNAEVNRRDKFVVQLMQNSISVVSNTRCIGWFDRGNISYDSIRTDFWRFFYDKGVAVVDTPKRDEYPRKVCMTIAMHNAKEAAIEELSYIYDFVNI